MITRISLAIGLGLSLAASAASADVPPPPAIVLDGAPTVPDALAADTQPYMQSRRAAFLGWNARDHSMLIKTRFGTTEQLHAVARPDGVRRQISFEAEPILTGALSPKGDVLVVQKDSGGDEFFQLYTLKDGRLARLTDGKSRNWFGAWSPNGRLIGYSSTRRNGADADLYVTDPSRPGSERMVAQVTGGGWNICDFSGDGRTALVINRQSVNRSPVYELDVASGALKPLTDPTKEVAYAGARYAPDGSIWVTSDKDSDFLRLGRLHAGQPRGPLGRHRLRRLAGRGLRRLRHQRSRGLSPAGPGRRHRRRAQGRGPAARRDPLQHRPRHRDRSLGPDRAQRVVGQGAGRRLLGRRRDARRDPVDP
jgi:hypothetical protein